MTRYIILIFFLGFSIELDSQDASRRSLPIVLHYADEMQGTNTDSTSFRRCIGNVRLSQGNVKVSCDRADHYITENRAVLIGNVVITQDTLVLKATEVKYDGNNGIADSYSGVKIINGNTVLTAENGVYSTRTYIAEFYKNVVIDDDSAKIFADKIIYNRNTGESKAFGTVLVKGKYTNIMLIGDSVKHYPKRNYTIATGKPIMVQIDTVLDGRNQETRDNEDDSLFHNDFYDEDSRRVINKNEKIDSSSSREINNLSRSIKFDTLTIVSDTMETLRGENKERYIFKNRVEMVRGNVVAKAMNAEYDKKGEIIRLDGMPIVWYDSTQLYADSTVIELQNNKLKQISAIGDAFAGSRDDTIRKNLINQLSGYIIKIKFWQDTILKIECIGHAKSLYFMSDSAGTEGAARNSSDTIFINFQSGKADEIFWLSGVEGEFLPVNILNQNPKDYFLPSYRWNDSKPRKRLIVHKMLNSK
jgi:lipopolysaccharide export system protein LptA